jgi:hypothetical protein
LYLLNVAGTDGLADDHGRRAGRAVDATPMIEKMTLAMLTDASAVAPSRPIIAPWTAMLMPQVISPMTTGRR